MVGDYERIGADQRMVLEYKFFEPAFYHTDVPDWGTSYAQCTALGERAVVCLDTGTPALYILRPVGSFAQNNLVIAGIGIDEHLDLAACPVDQPAAKLLQTLLDDIMIVLPPGIDADACPVGM